MVFDLLPRLQSPKLAEPSWRRVALDHGLFRDLDQALNWEHDTVFILDLTRTDTDCISSEDIAKFRNLRELVLRHTKVQTLPDAVFHLKNLNRIDIRDTPIPPAETERIRSQLPARVKLVANRPRRTPT
jgi:Leucine-rich repeat (LRR) protein